MIELSTFAAIVLILGLLIIPRTTFLVVWFFNASVVAAILGGSATILSVLAFLVFPKVLLAYLFLEVVAGAPASGSVLYWIYLGLAFGFDLGTKQSIKNTREK
jgi:hypothetical protein